MSIDGWPSSRSLLRFLLILTGGFLGCGSESAPQTDTHAADVAALHELRDELTRAQNAGDVRVFERISASDVLAFPPDGSLIAGRQALMNFNQEFFNRSRTIFDNKSAEIVVSGDWGFDRGVYRYTETPRAGGRTVVTEGNYLWLARREPDGVWRYARILWNTRNPPPLIEE